jgi:hypothetical protein
MAQGNRAYLMFLSEFNNEFQVKSYEHNPDIGVLLDLMPAI